MNQVFVTQEPNVNDSHKNLTPLVGVDGAHGMVIKEPESGVFFINKFNILCFQREGKFNLASIAHLVRLHQGIKLDSGIAK